MTKPGEAATSQELLALENATRDLVGVALRSVHGLEVSLPQFRLLWLLDEIGPASASQCAQMLSIAASSITRLTDRLDESGHLARETHPSNRSAVQLSLTEAGHDLVRGVRARRRREMELALDSLDAEDRAAGVKALHALHEALTGTEDPRIPF